MKMEKHTIQRTLAAVFIVCFALIGKAFPLGEAQRIGVNGGASDLSAFESIDPFGGSLSFRIPIGSVAGRGGFGYDLAVGTQNLWYVSNAEFPPCPEDDENCISQPPQYFFNGITTTGEFGPLTINGQVFQPATPGSNTFLPVIIRRDKKDHFERQSESNQIYSADTLTALTVRMSDGSFHTLYDTQTNGQPFHGTYNGSFLPESSGYDRGTVFRSTDGSDITAVSSADIHDSVPNNPWSYGFSGTLFTKDGTRFTINGSVTSVSDRNGNITNFEYDSSGGGRVTKVTTPNGTNITFAYGIAQQPTTFPDEYINTVTYAGTGGQTRQVKIHYSLLHNALRPAVNGHSAETLKTVHELFANDAYITNGNYDPYVLSQVEYPGTRSFSLKYNSYGELAMVTLPTGSMTTYEYGSGFGTGTGAFWNGSWDVNRRIKQRSVYDETGAEVSRRIFDDQTHSSSGAFNGYTQEQDFTTGQGGQLNRVSKTVHYFYGNPILPTIPGYAQSYYLKWDTGKEYKTEVYDADGTTLLRRSEQLWKQKNNGTFSWWTTTSGIAEPANEPHAIATKTTLADSGQVNLSTFKYDDLSNLTDTYTYDLGNGTPGSFLKQTHTDYQTDVSYTGSTGAYLRALPLETTVIGPITTGLSTIAMAPPDLGGFATPSTPSQGQVYSRTRFEYDNVADQPLVSRSDVFGHDTSNYGVSKTLRGNVTKVTSYSNVDDTNSSILVKSQYDILGNVVKTTDANGNSSEVSYDDRFGSPDADALANTQPAELPSGLHTFAFPTSISNAFDWTTYAQYDYYTGAVVDAEDINGVVSSTFSNDALDRPTQTIAANNIPALRSQTTTSYDDSNRMVTVTSDRSSFGDNAVKGESFYDGFGRTIEKRAYETDGGYVTTLSQFDAYGRTAKISNPFRPTEINANSPIVWTTSKYDSLGRGIETEFPDGTKSTTTYFGNVVTVTDASGRKGRSVSNALGEVVRVDEPTSMGGSETSDLGSLSSPTQSTTYFYNTLGNMVRVQQGVQNRYFMFDSLGRLLRVRQPEQEPNTSLSTTGNPDNNTWSAGLTYDNNGNVLTTTDAKGTNIVSTYDTLNRPLTRTYSDGTPTVTNYYDGAGLPSVPDFSKGKRTRVSNSISDSRYTGFDALGRTLQAQQITDGQTYTSSYEYDFSGALVQETYPSGRVVQNEFDGNGDLAKVSSAKASASILVPYISNFHYTATGLVSQARLGNGKWETAKFNNRLQVTELGIGASATDTGLWKSSYEYGELDSNGITDTTKNTGNIAKQIISFTGLANPITEAFRYDPLDRITEAKETTGGNQSWIQNWGYDRYGNRSSFSQNIGGNTSATNPTVDTYTNRFSANQGFTYDKNGNVVQDVDTTNQARTYVFNGDNRQAEVRDATGNPVGIYYYDGEGKRVKKVTDTETTIFVYSSDKLIAEYSTQMSETPAISYTTTDQLGSPRVITDQLGQIISRRDFLPFGEEVHSGVGPRTTALKFDSVDDNVRQRFAGFQSDSESSLDFAEARMYESRYGRFTAIDPLLASGKSTNPQTFNRFAYTSNNPVTRADRNGNDWYAVMTTVLLYGTHHVNVWTPVWHDGTTYGAQRWNGGAVFYIAKGEYKGMWGTLDPWNNRWTVSSSKENAEAAYQAYQSQMKQDLGGGVAHAVADVIDGAIFNPFIGHPTRELADDGLNAAGIHADEASDVHRTTYRTTNATTIVLSAVTGGSGEAGAVSETTGITNPVPQTLARVIPGEGPFPTLGPPGSADVFVTAAEDIRGLNASELGPKLHIQKSDVYTVFEFPTPRSGLASPVYRHNPGFLGFGRTRGGAREFVIPNGPIPCVATVRRVC